MAKRWLGEVDAEEEERQRLRDKGARLEELQEQIDVQLLAINEEWDRLRGWESRLMAQEQLIEALLQWLVATAVIVGVLLGAQIAILIRTGRKAENRGKRAGQRRAELLALTRVDGAADRVSDPP